MSHRYGILRDMVPTPVVEPEVVEVVEQPPPPVTEAAVLKPYKLDVGITIIVDPELVQWFKETHLGKLIEVCKMFNFSSILGFAQPDTLEEGQGGKGYIYKTSTEQDGSTYIDIDFGFVKKVVDLSMSVINDFASLVPVIKRLNPFQGFGSKVAELNTYSEQLKTLHREGE